MGKKITSNELAIWVGTQLAEKRWSQRRLALAAGVSHSTIGRICRGESEPTLDTLRVIGRALAVPLPEALRQATLPATAPHATALLQECLSLIAALDPADQVLVFEIIHRVTRMAPEHRPYALELITFYDDHKEAEDFW